MSVDYDNRERVFKAGIEGLFHELAASLAVDAENMLDTLVAAYRQDLIDLDVKARVLDDLVAIVKTGSAPDDDMEGGKYRKMVEALKGKGYVPKT